MLLALSLQDFVLVEKLDLNFQGGFTVLTGETGAGKSVTLDAVGLLLGDKADYAQVRTGAKEARLSALFDLSALPDLAAELRDQGLLDEDAAELSLRRIIDAKGRSRSFINNQTATLAQLKHIGEQLIDIHGQNAHQSLNREAAQRELLDAFAGCLPLAQEVAAAYRARQSALAALKAAEEQAEQLQIERERLEWQQGELSRLAPAPGEWESLSQSHDSLAHAAELVQTAREVEDIIDGERGLQYYVYRCQKNLESLSGIEPRFAEALELLASVEAELGDHGRAVAVLGESLRHAQATHGNTRLRDRVAQRPAETALDDTVLDAHDAVVVPHQRRQIRADRDHPLRVRNSDADSVSSQAARGLDRVGRARASTHDEHPSG